MQTQQQDCYPFSARTSTDRQCRPAAEHVALFPTRLALARWMRGGDIPHVYVSTRNIPERAAWYDQAQRQFQAWLEGGGFHAE